MNNLSPRGRNYVPVNPVGPVSRYRLAETVVDLYNKKMDITLQIAEAGMSFAEAKVIQAEGDRIREWLAAERHYHDQVRRWLDAEAKHQASEQKFDVKTYRLARKGWEQVKQFVPRLDGVDRFEDLAESLQFRYAAFAAAVLDLEVPAEVKSSKQERTEDDSSTGLDTEWSTWSDWYWDE